MSATFEQSLRTYPLWENLPDGLPGIPEVDGPCLRVAMPADPAKHTGGAVVLCPGGGYTGLSMGNEGYEVLAYIAKELNALGALLEYRIPTRGHTHPAPLHDAQRAIRFLRAQAQVWKLDPDKVGIWGFSAGGHLAGCTGVFWEGAAQCQGDALDAFSARPSFMILVYPVTTFRFHNFSFKNLFGGEPTVWEKHAVSLPDWVTFQSSPTYLIHGQNDSIVRVGSANALDQALTACGVEHRYVRLANAEHGFGLARTAPWLSTDAKGWTDDLHAWLRGRL